MARNTRQTRPLDGRGPYRFDSPAIAPGEFWKLDLRTVEYNGTKRYFRRFLPFDSAQLTNSSDSTRVDITYNGRFDATVVPNSIETFDQQGITFLTVSVPSSASSGIAAGELTVELTKEPYNADDEARENARRSSVSKFIENVTGVPL